MTFFEEYKKMIACLVLLIFLFAVMKLTDNDMMPWIKQILDIVMVLLGGAAIKFSVLKSSQKKFIKNNTPTPPASDTEYSDPLVRNPNDDWKI